MTYTKLDIDGKTYQIRALTPAARFRYRRLIEEIALRDMNPWQELYERIKHLPEHLQEIIFAKPRKEILPLTLREMNLIASRPEVVQALLDVSVVNPPDVTEDNAIDIYLALGCALGDSLLDNPPPVQEQRLTGEAAIAFAQKQAAEAKEKSDVEPG